MRQKRAIIFEKLQNFIQNENNSHLVTYESAGFGGFYIKNRFFFQEYFLNTVLRPYSEQNLTPKMPFCSL